jgi:hypothetical protein
MAFEVDLQFSAEEQGVGMIAEKKQHYWHLEDDNLADLASAVIYPLFARLEKEQRKARRTKDDRSYTVRASVVMLEGEEQSGLQEIVAEDIGYDQLVRLEGIIVKYFDVALVKLGKKANIKKGIRRRFKKKH